MGRGFFVVVVLLGGCGPRVEEVCVEVEWVRALEDAAHPCDVAVRSDGTIGVLTRDAVIEIDEHGEALGSRGLTAPDGGEFRWCRTIVADRQDRWWVVGTIDVGALDRSTWLFRLDPDGTAEAKLLRASGEHFLGKMVGWNDGVLVGGFDERGDPRADERRVAVVYEIDPSLDVVDEWISGPELGSVHGVLDVGRTLLVLAKPPSIDYADGELLRLDGLDRAPTWTRTVGVLDGLTGEGIHAASSSTRHALFVSAASELVDPDAPPPEPTSGLPFIPETRLRWSIEAWNVDGDLAWTRDLTTEAVVTGNVAASDDVILAWLGGLEPTEDEP